MSKLDDLKAAADKIKASLAPLGGLKGWSGVLGFFQAAPHVVDAVEQAAKDLGLDGPDKKALAVELIVELVPNSWCPDFILRPLVSFAIERAVAAINKRFAK